MNQPPQYALAYVWIIGSVGAALIMFFRPWNVTKQNSAGLPVKGDCVLADPKYCEGLSRKDPKPKFTQAQLDEVLLKHKAWLKRIDEKQPNIPKDQQADLRNKDLQGLNLTSKDLRWAILTSASFGPEQTDLRGADLGGAAMACSDLRGAVLENAKLNLGADLTSARMCDAHLDGANLEGATLTGSNLANASLVGAKLTRIIHKV